MILLQTKSNHPANKNAIPRQSYLLLLGSTAQHSKCTQPSYYCKISVRTGNRTTDPRVCYGLEPITCVRAYQATTKIGISEKEVPYNGKFCTIEYFVVFFDAKNECTDRPIVSRKID